MEKRPSRQGMDTFTRRYAIALGVIAMAGLIAWLASRDSRVSELNAILASDAQLSAYPYQFRVLSLEGGVAQVSSPRSANVSVIQFLRIIREDLKNASATDAAMMEAQQELARTQSRAGELLVAEPDVAAVSWVLDEKWFASHGGYLN